MGNSFVLFDVSIVISHGQFHCGNRGHTQNADFPWVKSHFPVGKRSSGTTAIVNRALVFIAAVALVLRIRFGVDAGYFLVVLVYYGLHVSIQL